MAQAHSILHPHPKRHGAFTLVELMISLFLALLLVLGINSIFKMSADTVGSGMQLSDVTRLHRAARVTLEKDFEWFADPSVQPAFILQMGSAPAFRDQKDEKSDPFYARNQTNVNTAMENCLLTSTDGTIATKQNPHRLARAGANAPSIIFDNRNHRLDVMAFGMSGTFARQTGSNLTGVKPYQTPFTAGEAWVYYGHLKLLDDNGINVTGGTNNPTTAGKPPPGFIPTNAGGAAQTPITNPNNFYASQWVLGRSVILLSDVDSNGQIPDNNGANQEFFPAASDTAIGAANRNKSANPNSKLDPYAPLCPFSWSTDTSSQTALYFSFCDLAGTTLSGYRSQIETGMYNTTVSPATRDPAWYRHLIYSRGTSRTIPTGTGGVTWSDLCRFHGSAYLRKAVNQNMARNVELTSPLFIKGCSQFMVEYAGDYLTQTAAGVATDVGEDGQLDFDLVNGARKIRWYGLTRSTDGTADEITGGLDPTSRDPLTVTTLGNPPTRPQVIHPLWMHLAKIGKAPLPFEKIGAAATTADRFPLTRLSHTDSYTCAWSPDDISFDKNFPDPNNNTTVWLAKFPSRTFLPWLIRITIRIDDPNGRLPDGVTMEYVFKLPRPSL